MLSSWVCSVARSVNVRTERATAPRFQLRLARIHLCVRFNASYGARLWNYAIKRFWMVAARICTQHFMEQMGLRAYLKKINRARGRALVVAQVAGSMLLLVVAGLFTRSLFGAEHANLGFDPKNVVNFTMDPLPSRLPQSAEHRIASKSLVDRLSRFGPSVVSVSARPGHSSPMGYITIEDALTISDYRSRLVSAYRPSFNTIRFLRITSKRCTSQCGKAAHLPVPMTTACEPCGGLSTRPLPGNIGLAKIRLVEPSRWRAIHNIL